MLPRCDVELEISAVLPFADDEDCLVGVARRVAAHLRGLGHRFELLAADEGTVDNSLALLSLVRHEVPELQLVVAAPGRGFAVGSLVARGRTLWLLDPACAPAPGVLALGAFQGAHARIVAGTADLSVVAGRYLVARRTRVWRAIERTTGRGDAFERRLTDRAERAGLRVERGTGGAPHARRPGSWLLRRPIAET
ncbi:MAG: hypothetical protein EXR73_15070 [Myxococcales bacterium]|nr:hypothetical protein [Myxococcales bacterium]